MSSTTPPDPWANPPEPPADADPAPPPVTNPTEILPDPGTAQTQAFPVGPGAPAPLPPDPYAVPPVTPPGGAAPAAPAYAPGAVPPPPVMPGPAVPPPPAYPGQYPPQYPGGYPGYGYAAASQTSQNATIALVLAIVAWLLCPVIPAIVALVLCRSAKQEIAASGGRVSGEGLVTAAKVISWLNIAFYVAFGLLMLALLAFGFFAAATVPSITTFPTASFSLGA